MFIPDKNETLYEVIYTSLTQKEKNIKNLKEFGYYEFSVFPEEETSNFIVAFNCPDFKEIYEYSGKEYFENAIKEFEAIPNYKGLNKEYNIAFKIDYSKFKLTKLKKKKDMTEEELKKFEEEEKEMAIKREAFAKNAAEKLSSLRVNFYSSVIDKMTNDLIAKKPTKKITVHLNQRNLLHIIPADDRVRLIYGIDFQQSTDIALTKIFLQELKEANRHIKNCISAEIYNETDNIPKFIIDHDRPKNYSNGLVSFNLYTKNYKTTKPLFNYFITLREYIQFHIHSIKTFLHIRMSKKGKYWLGHLDGCRIIPTEYIKSLGISQYYENFNKKEENIKAYNAAVKNLK